MKRFTRLFFLMLLPFMIPALIMAQHYVPIEPLNKNAILEEFTGVSCPNCPAGHQVMHQILLDHPDRAFCVAYHPFNSSYTNPFPGDPDLRRHFGDSLYMTPYCGTSRYMPSAFVQRRLWSPPERLNSRTDWPGHTNTILAEPSPMNVGMATHYDEATSMLTVVVDIYYTEDFTGDHNLMVTLAENDLVTQQSGASGPYTHKHTFREAFVGQWGDPIVTDATAGTFYTRTFTFDYSATGYIMENCELLAFVIDNASTEVITGVGCAAGDTTYITPDVELTADTLFYENPTQCLEGQIVSIENNTEGDLDLLFVQQENEPSSDFPWYVDPWPFTSFPATLSSGESVDLNVILPLPVEGESGMYYDALLIVSAVDTQEVVLAVNEGLYSGINDPLKGKDASLSAYPSPFSVTSTIAFNLRNAQHVTLQVFNLNGSMVKTLMDQGAAAGENTVVWDGTTDAGKAVNNGVYFIRLQTSDAVITRRIVHLD